MSSTPFCIVSRSESCANRCGSHESVAMLAITRGPSMKPACAATKRSAASATSVSDDEPAADRDAAEREPAREPLEQDGVHASCPSSGAAWKSRYRSRIPPAVTASETAM